MKKYDVIALGELLIDFTQNGLSEQGNGLFEANPGGAPCNVLSMLNNLGKKTSFIGKVGNDQFGKTLKKALEELGIGTENLLMEAVKRGGNRQELHEVIRRCSHAASAKMKEGEPCDLLRRLAAEPAFSMSEEDLAALLKPEDYIGRCPEQVDAFLRKAWPVLEDACDEAADIEL